jgi:predicted transglutaminase-like cysteine proteinase
MIPALAPMGWTEFVRGIPRASDLALVNDRVNARIEGTDADVSKPWCIVMADDADLTGACHEFACTKRAELLGLGWPASRLLLAEVKYDKAEDHMVLIAVGDDGSESVLDNLRPDIVAWADAEYVLVKRQTAMNANLWQAP